MKKVLLYSAFALGTLTMNTGCGEDFLMINPVGSVSEATLTTPEGIDYVLTGAYSTFNNMRQTQGNGGAALSNWVWGDIVGADANKGSTAGDQSDLTQLETYTFTAANGYILGRWNAVYESVKRANNVISMANKLEDAQYPEKATVIAQAKFIKAVWMFEAIRTFGAAVPYVSLEDYEANTDPQVTNIDESGNYIYIWDKVEQDFKDAIAGLPETWGDGNYGRATSWQAKAMLAKLYLYWSSPYNGTNDTKNHVADAADLLDDIIANGKDAKGQKYQLAENYYDLWQKGEKSDWTGESVFDIQTCYTGTQYHTSSVYHEWMTGNPGAMGIGGWGFYQPTNEFVNSFLVDDAGLPLATYTSVDRLSNPETVPDLDEDGNEQYDDDGKLKTKTQIVTKLETYTDPRVDMCAGRFEVPFFDYGTPLTTGGWVRDVPNGGVYLNKKHLPYNADRTAASTTYPASSDINYHVIRFADILLMRAECDILDGGDTKLAFQYINKVRARAAKSYLAGDATTKGNYVLENLAEGKTVTGTAANYRVGLYQGTDFASVDAAWTALKREMRAEFGMEGHRWFDIARWGEVADVLNAFRDYESEYMTKYTNPYNAAWVNFPIPNSQINTAEGRIKQNVNYL